MKVDAQTIVYYVSIFLVMTALGYLYRKYNEKQEMFSDAENYKLIQQYLLNESPLSNSSKPIMWIHVPHEINARNWINFGSRNSRDLNQPFLRMSIKSIIQHCSGSFNICLIDDNTFNKLLTGWIIQVDKLADPVKTHVRELAMKKLLFMYGGMIVPPYFICQRDLIGMYYEYTKSKTPFIVNMINNQLNEENGTGRNNVYPSQDFMGAKKEDPLIQELVQEIEILNSRDFTAQIDVVGQVNLWCANQVNAGKMKYVSPREVGLYDRNNKLVMLEDLMSSEIKIDWAPKMYGVIIPYENLMRRRHYGWFIRCSEEQIRENASNLAQLLSAALEQEFDDGVNGDPSAVATSETQLNRRDLMPLPNKINRASGASELEHAPPF